MLPIERAARALVKSQSGVDYFDAHDPEPQAAIRDDVIAVIKGLREPMPGMLLAGHKLLEDERGHAIGTSDAHGAWQVMVDAALAAPSAAQSRVKRAYRPGRLTIESAAASVKKRGRLVGKRRPTF